MEKEFFVAGVKFHESHLVMDELEVGTEFDMVAEPDNKYDPNAVRLEFDYVKVNEIISTMIGYVPAKFSAEIAAFLEIGEDPICLITELNPQSKPWERIKVVIKEGEDGG